MPTAPTAPDAVPRAASPSLAGEAAAAALANLCRATTQALDQAAQNARAAQHQLQLLAQEATAAGVAKIRSTVAAPGTRSS